MIRDYILLLLVLTIISPIISARYLHKCGSRHDEATWGCE
jgi:multisubunit Na+/H+ antiporter MnhF subunit